VGPRGTWLIVAAVGLLAALAAADALRGSGDGERPAAAPTSATSTRSRAPTVQEELRREGVAGIITYSDDRCLLHTLFLPGLEGELVRREDTEAPIRRCTFAVGAGRFLPDDVQVSPRGMRTAHCLRGHVEVVDVVAGQLVSRVRGCTPAWRPDGALTYVRDDEVFVGDRLLLSRRDLRKASNAHPNVRSVEPGYPVRVQVTSLAWFDQKRLSAVLAITIRGVERQYLLAVFEGRHFVGGAVRFTGPFGELITSDDGAYVADEGGMIMTRDGEGSELPAGLPDGRLVAFSPDDRWVAFVTPGSIYLVAGPANEGAIRILRLPFGAEDAVWEPGGPTIDTTTTAR
jgi:hypothetical protein